MARKKRNYKAEYRRRIESGTSKGYSRSQAAGKPRRGEYLINPRVPREHYHNYLGLKKRIDDLDVSDRPYAITLLNRCLRKPVLVPLPEGFFGPLELKGGFERRIEVDKEPTAFDLLLTQLADVEGEFSLGTSDPTAKLLDQFEQGMWQDKLQFLSPNLREYLGLNPEEI